MRKSGVAKSSDNQGIVDHSQSAYKGIRRMLYYKELVPGQKIACRELAERLKMSSTPVIQAPAKIISVKGTRITRLTVRTSILHLDLKRYRARGSIAPGRALVEFR